MAMNASTPTTNTILTNKDKDKDNKDKQSSSTISPSLKEQLNEKLINNNNNNKSSYNNTKDYNRFLNQNDKKIVSRVKEQQQQQQMQMQMNKVNEKEQVQNPYNHFYRNELSRTSSGPTVNLNSNNPNANKYELPSYDN